MSWGLSPVTRQTVNGFTRVPSFRAREEWLAFADWRGSGYLGLRELAALFAASLPVPHMHARRETGVAIQRVADLLLRSTNRDVVSFEDLRTAVLPSLERRSAAVEEASRPRTPQPQSPDQWNELPVEHVLEVHLWSLRSLRACSTHWRTGAGVLLALDLCMLFTHPQVRQSLHIKTLHMHAARMFKRLGDGGLMRAQNEVLRMLDDPKESICKLGLSLLPSVVARGHKRAICALAKVIQCGSANVRSTVVSLLEHLSEKGNEATIQSFIACLVDDDLGVQCMAAKALAQIAPPGSPDVVAAVSACLSVCPSDARRLMIKTVVKVAKRGNRQAIAAVLDHVFDSNPTIRLTAASSLGNLADRGDKDVVKILISRLALENESDAHMRWTALAGLAQVAARNDPNVIEVVCNQLEDGRSFVEQEALRTLAHLALNGDQRVIQCVAHHATSNDATTRWVALQTLGQLALPGCELTTSVAKRLLLDTDVLVRLEAGRVHTSTNPKEKEEDSSPWHCSPPVENLPWRCSALGPMQDLHEYNVPLPLPEEDVAFSCNVPVACAEVKAKAVLPGSRWRERQPSHLEVGNELAFGDAPPLFNL